MPTPIVIPPVFGWHSQHEQQQYAEADPAATPAADPATPPAADPATPPAEPQEVDQLPAWAQKIIADARTGEAARRAEAKAQKAEFDAFKTGLTKALGGSEPEVETDPAKLAQRIAEKDSTISAKDAEIKARDLHIAALSSPAARGANADLLLKSEAFKTSIASVDPTDGAAITAAITAVLQANPALKATPPSSGSDGHQGGQIKSLEAQLATAEKTGDTSTSIILKRRIAALKTAS